MENRNDLLENKKKEITSTISAICISYCGNSHYSLEIMQHFLEKRVLLITPPQEDPPMMQMLTMDFSKNFRKGQSIKPGNIKLNIRHLIYSLPDITSSCANIALDNSLLQVCAIFSVLKMLLKIATIEITKEQALTIIALWNNCDNHQRITLENGFQCFSLLYKQIEATEATWEQYIKIIDELNKLSSIQLDDNGIQLCEEVSIRYIK